jgi:Zn-dependent peptidase ImmA (M78 family)
MLADPVVDPIPTNASKANVHAFAERVAQSFMFAPGDPLEPFVARLGGRIQYRDAIGFESRLPESIVVMSESDFVIFLPTMTSVERDRFTIAHELGHYFLHYPMCKQKDPNAQMVATRWVDTSNSLQQRAEWEANWFAAAFLMPVTAFTNAIKNFGRDFARIAGRFVVSTQAAEIRAKTLGL